MFGRLKRKKRMQNPFFGIATTGWGGFTPRGEHEPDSLVKLRSDFERLRKDYKELKRSSGIEIKKTLDVDGFPRMFIQDGYIDVASTRDKLDLLTEHLGLAFKTIESTPEHLKIVRAKGGQKEL